MDLLDALEDRSHRATFKINYDADISTIKESKDEKSIDILKEVKQRLAGIAYQDSQENEGELATQLVKSGENDSYDMANSLLFAEAEADTQRLPQLDAEDAEIEIELPEMLSQTLPSLHSQEIASDNNNSLVSSDKEEPSTHKPVEEEAKENEDEDEDEDEDAIMTVEDRRLKKLNKLIEMKRQERLAKEKENNKLEADISNTTLTDEEDDLRDQYVTIEGREDEQNLKEAQMFLQIQKRNRNLQPNFEKKKVFTAEMLAAAFEDPEPLISKSDKESNIDLDSAKSSPITSPLKNKNDISTNPISIYAKQLKNQILSSPTKKDVDDSKILIDLNSDLSSSDDEEEIPQLSKDKVLHIKQKFLSKKLNNQKDEIQNLPKSLRNTIVKPKPRPNLFTELRKANIDQLQVVRNSDPLNQTMKELEKDEEEMGNLLEREMERVRNIRKREKLLERAKSVLMTGDLNDKTPLEETEVPDSDFEYDHENESEDDDNEKQEDNESTDESNDDEAQDSLESTFINGSRRKPKIINEDENDQETETADKLLREDDSYMFGAISDADDSDSYDNIKEKFITTSSLQTSSVSSNHRPKVENQTEYKLFQNLAPIVKRNSLCENQISEEKAEDLSHLKVLSFQDLSQNLPIPSQQDTQVDSTPTQADSVETQLVPNYVDSENIDETKDEDEDEAITPVNYRRARRMIQKQMEVLPEDENEDEDENENENENENVENNENDEELKLEMAKRQKEFEQNLRKKELKLRKRRKEMERKGIKNMFDAEAEESEDEWKGIGGVDGDLSDVANSEDEKMIDNDFNIDLNDTEVRNKFMEQFHIKDRQDLEKLLDDVKNHKLTKRIANKNGFDIELSDEEDELLAAYRKQRLEEQKARMLGTLKSQSLSGSAKSNAFFATIQEEQKPICLDDESEDNVELSDEKESMNEKGLEEELEIKKKTIRVDEYFVQRQLSFLSNSANNQEVEYLRLQRISNHQHGYLSEDEMEDLQSIKRRCLNNLSCKSSQQSFGVDPFKAQEEGTDVDENSNDGSDDDNEFFNLSRKASLVKSFRDVNKGVEVKTGAPFTKVVTSNSYKAVSSTKASITAMTSAARKGASSLKEKRIMKTVASIKNKNLTLFNKSEFE